MGEIYGIKKCYFQRSIFRLVRSRAESSTDLYFNFDLCWWKTAGTRLRLNTTNQSWALGLAQSIIFLCLSQWLPASLLSQYRVQTLSWCQGEGFSIILTTLY